MGMSQERINALVELYRIMYPKVDLTTAQSVIENSRVGNAIRSHNQLILHDDVTANICDILLEVLNIDEVDARLSNRVARSYEIYCEKEKQINKNDVIKVNRASASKRNNYRKLLKKYQKIKAQQEKSYRIEDNYDS